MKNFKLVMELIGMSVLINENTEYCSFVNFSGHVSKVEIRVFPSKERCIESSDRLYSIDLHYDPIRTDWKGEQRILSELEDAKRILSGYLYNFDGPEIDQSNASCQLESTRP